MDQPVRGDLMRHEPQPGEMFPRHLNPILDLVVKSYNEAQNQTAQVNPGVPLQARGYEILNISVGRSRADDGGSRIIMGFRVQPKPAAFPAGPDSGVSDQASLQIAEDLRNIILSPARMPAEALHEGGSVKSWLRYLLNKGETTPVDPSGYSAVIGVRLVGPNTISSALYPFEDNN